MPGLGPDAMLTEAMVEPVWLLQYGDLAQAGRVPRLRAGSATARPLTGMRRWFQADRPADAMAGRGLRAGGAALQPHRRTHSGRSLSIAHGGLMPATTAMMARFYVIGSSERPNNSTPPSR